MTLLRTRPYYKPFEYPWAFDAYLLQQKVHWLPEEVPLLDDVKDWNQKLSEEEKGLLTQLFRFFTQADLDIASGYINRFLPAFKPPEIRMMLSAFANMESVHIHAYSLLLDTIGMPEAEYQAFQEYKEMAEKHEYLEAAGQVFIDGHLYVPNLPVALAVNSVFGEGLQLFSSFAILMNFPRFNKMKGMGQIVTWSVRDESLHVDSMIKLFHTFLDENPHLWTEDMKRSIYQCCREMVKLEDKFIDLAFAQGGIEGLTSQEVKKYIRYIADRRLLQLGLKPNYRVKENPLPWLDWVLGGVEHANFFENRATEYSKGSLTGNWSEVWS